MNKAMYSEDIIWYDTNVYNSILALSDEHDNAIPVFGAALSASKYTLGEYPNLDKFVSFLDDVAHSAEFFNWHGGVLHALKTFCHLCGIDPYLVEAYLGISLEDVYA